MIIAGGVATALCSGAIAAVGEIYPTPPEVLNLGGSPTEAERTAAAVAQRAVNAGNAMVWLGTSGAILAGVLALGSGLTQRAGLNTAVGVLVGILAGGGLGVLAGKLAVSYHASIAATLIGATSKAEQQFMAMHGMTWGLIGLGTGLGCGLSRQSIEAKSVIVSVIVAGVLGCIAGGVFPIILGVTVPLVSSATPIAAEGVGRVIWIGLTSILIAVGLGRSK